MYKKDFERLSKKAAAFKALAHPSRIFILENLIKREHCVGELTEMLGVEMPTVSKHLSVLKNVGIISSRKENNSVYYKIQMECVKDTLACADKALKKHQLK